MEVQLEDLTEHPMVHEYMDIHNTYSYKHLWLACIHSKSHWIDNISRAVEIEASWQAIHMI